MKYRIETDNFTYPETTDLQQALLSYETVKDTKMGEGVTNESYVELVSSEDEDDFDVFKVRKRAMVEVDEEKMAISTPKENGYDWEYWAKWEEMIDDRTFQRMIDSLPNSPEVENNPKLRGNDKMTKESYCNRCDNKVGKSDLKEYTFQCFECDEDLYACETHEKTEASV